MIYFVVAKHKHLPKLLKLWDETPTIKTKALPKVQFF